MHLRTSADCLKLQPFNSSPFVGCAINCAGLVLFLVSKKPALLEYLTFIANELVH